MASVIINGIQYPTCPEVDVPKVGGGIAKFMDTDDATAVAAGILDGQTAYARGEKVTGNIASKAAATYTPTTSDQTIAAGQYLAGAQTVKGDANLLAANIRSGATGTVYVPQALIPTYQAATNWKTLYDAGTVTFAAIEGSEYEI